MEDYKEKYEQLTKFIRDLYPFMTPYCKEKTEAFFSTHRESEDEGIRKAIVEHIKGITSWNYFLGISKEQMLAWLEKQGELVEKYEDKLDRISCESFDKGYKAAVEKQGHKFNIGDIISNTNVIFRVENIIKNCLGQDCYFLVNVKKEKDGTRYLTICDSDGTCRYAGETIWVCEQVDAKFEKQSEQKPAWSEEDEKLLKLSLENLTELRNEYGEKYGKVGDCIQWLETIKRRMKGETK